MTSAFLSFTLPLASIKFFYFNTSAYCGNFQKQVEQMKLKTEDKDEIITKLTLESEAYQMELENYVAKTNVSLLTPSTPFQNMAPAGRVRVYNTYTLL